VRFRFKGEVIEWRGPAPFYFVATPRDVTDQISEIKNQLSYGWGVIPARVSIAGTTITTSLIPKEGSYYVPLKDAIRKPNQIQLGQMVDLVLEL